MQKTYEKFPKSREYIEIKPPKYMLIFTLFSILSLVIFYYIADSRTLEIYVKSPGVLQAEGKSIITSEISGFVVYENTEDGEVVTDSTLLLELDNSEVYEEIRYIEKQIDNLSILIDIDETLQYYKNIEFYNLKIDYINSKIDEINDEITDIEYEISMYEKYIEAVEENDKTMFDEDEETLYYLEFRQYWYSYDSLLETDYYGDDKVKEKNEDITNMKNNEKYRIYQIIEVLNEEIYTLHQSIDDYNSSIDEYKSSIIQNETSIEDYKNTKIQYDKQILDYELQISKLYETLSDYKIYADNKGYLQLDNEIQVSQYVQAGSIIGEVYDIPIKLYAELIIPSKDITKLEVGQDVRIETNSFKSKEYGYLSGVISKVPKDSNVIEGNNYYLVEVELDSQYMVYDNNIGYLKPGLEITGEVIVEEKTILTWLLDKLDIFIDVIKY